MNNVLLQQSIHQKNKFFRVFDLALEDIKVVILGQDPYHNPDQACGLSFSVNDGVPLPKKLNKYLQRVV